MIWLVLTNKQAAFANDYPPVVTDKLREKGLIAPKPPARKSDIVRKVIALLVYAILFALLLRYVNGIDTFFGGAFTAYALWAIVDWYDFLVMDVLAAPFDKFYKESGVSAFDKSSVWFHFKGSLRGMLYGLAFAPITGLIIILI